MLWFVYTKSYWILELFKLDWLNVIGQILSKTTLSPFRNGPLDFQNGYPHVIFCHCSLTVSVILQSNTFQASFKVTNGKSAKNGFQSQWLLSNFELWLKQTYLPNCKEIGLRDAPCIVRTDRGITAKFCV